MTCSRIIRHSFRRGVRSCRNGLKFVQKFSISQYQRKIVLKRSPPQSTFIKNENFPLISEETDLIEHPSEMPFCRGEDSNTPIPNFSQLALDKKERVQCTTGPFVTFAGRGYAT